MNAQVSVIIPVHNTIAYLKEAIESIINQKKYVHEIIIIDDGSTDGSSELLDDLYSKYEFIKIIHTENQRQGPARNLGTQISNGDFIYYFDSDDIAVEGLFEAFNKKIKQYPDLEIFCFSGLPFIDGNYGADEETKKNLSSSMYYLRKITKLCETGEEAFNVLFPTNSFSPLPYLYMFKKSVIIRNNIRFREIRLEDEEFVFQLFLFSGKTYITEEIFCNRRMREGSTMQINRCFADMLGYMKTIETLEKLRNLAHLKIETKENLLKKIKILARSIIYMRVRNYIKLSQEEKIIYKEALRPYISKNFSLLFLYYTYSFEYKLRTLKQKFLNI